MKDRSSALLTKEIFKSIRLLLKETQPEFAKRLGYQTYRTITNKESGRKKIMLRDEVILRPFMKEVAARGSNQ